MNNIYIELVRYLRILKVELLLIRKLRYKLSNQMRHIREFRLLGGLYRNGI